MGIEAIELAVIYLDDDAVFIATEFIKRLECFVQLPVKRTEVGLNPNFYRAASFDWTFHESILKPLYRNSRNDLGTMLGSGRR